MIENCPGYYTEYPWLLVENTEGEIYMIEHCPGYYTEYSWLPVENTEGKSHMAEHCPGCSTVELNLYLQYNI